MKKLPEVVDNTIQKDERSFPLIYAPKKLATMSAPTDNIGKAPGLTRQ
jgi:hypothetical protein